MCAANAQPLTDPYHSRDTPREEQAPRVDPVVYGKPDDGPLSADQLSDFERNGFLFLPSLFSADEVADLQKHAAGLAKKVDPDQDWVIAEPDSQIVRSVFKVHRLDEAFIELAREPRLAGVARQILGSDVSVHQSRINFKPGFRGKEFYWHSDFETWHVEDGMPRPRAVSASIILTPNNEFNGPLMLVPGSHKVYVRCVGETPEDNYKSSLKKQEIGTPSPDALTAMVRDGGIVAPKGEAGSVIFFDCNTMHGSAGNISPFPRNNVFFVYNSVENALTEPFGADKPRPDFLGDRDAPPVGRL